ncbi:MAG: ribonuclease HII [Candidatus Kapabacteria bacterium]|nr:ribonuclease HII [Candidatus Kapabacteria bacterium]
MKSSTKIIDPSPEKNLWDKNIIFAGVDEAGRGALAGPVCAAAVILKPDDYTHSGIFDSKALSAEKRELIFDFIVEHSLFHSICLMDNKRIDRINILEATMEAMHGAITGLKCKIDLLLIDGNRFKSNGINYQTIIKGDSKRYSIAAASILAKVTRDRFMINDADVRFPEYNFKQNKGYGVPVHIEALRKFGVCDVHREKFVRTVLCKTGLSNFKLFI